MRALLIAFLMITGTAQAAENIGLAAVGLCAENPAAMADWYKKFDINLNLDAKSGVYSGMAGTKYPYHMAIYPAQAGDYFCPVKAQGFGFSIFVEGFEAYRNNLNDKGVRPFGPIMRESWGCLANFKDPENNNVSIFALAMVEEGGGIACQ